MAFYVLLLLSYSTGRKLHYIFVSQTERVATSPDLDLAFGTVDVNVDLACTSLLSPLSHLPPPISSPPSSAAAGEPIRDPGVFTIITIFFPCWWLSYNKLFYLSTGTAMAERGGTVERTVRRERQWRRGVAQWKECRTLPSPVGVEGMPTITHQLPRTMALGSRPGPGPDGARCTGAQQFWGV